MKPIRIPTLSPEQLDSLEKLYRTTREPRLRTRTQMVLLAAEQRMTAAEIAEIVRASEETVRRWLKRYLAEGVEGLRDVPHPGAPGKVTQSTVKCWCRRSGAVLAASGASVLGVDTASPGRPHGRTNRYPGGVRDCQSTPEGAEGIVLSRPQHTITSPDPEYALKKRRSKRPATTSQKETSSTTPTSSI